MKGFAKTDVGKAREMNQDYYCIPSSEAELQLYILADGMGRIQWRRDSKQASSRNNKKLYTKQF